MIQRYSTLKEEPTKEMFDYFYARTIKHISWVNKFFALLGEEFSSLSPTQTLRHDRDKFYGDLKIPYVFMSWKYKNPEFEYPSNMEEKVKQATLKHVLSNEHHPEFWDKEHAKINEEDRDAPSGIVINAVNMPLQHIAEMISDWASVGWERDKKPPRDWADKNIGVRWDFSKEQKDFIYRGIDIFEKALSKKDFLRGLK